MMASVREYGWNINPCLKILKMTNNNFLEAPVLVTSIP